VDSQESLDTLVNQELAATLDKVEHQVTLAGVELLDIAVNLVRVVILVSLVLAENQELQDIQVILELVVIQGNQALVVILGFLALQAILDTRVILVHLVIVVNQE
jgi:hypothetical protein